MRRTKVRLNITERLSQWDYEFLIQKGTEGFILRDGSFMANSRDQAEARARKVADVFNFEIDELEVWRWNPNKLLDKEPTL